MTAPERFLFGPGPSNPHPDVVAAMSQPLVGHLDPYFLELMDSTMNGLRRVFGTKNHHTIPLSGTGSAALECIMLNLLQPGDEALVGVIGHFGQRLAEMARRAGANVRVLEEPFGQIVDPSRVEDALRDKPAKLVALVHAETSTGVAQPLDDIARIARSHDALFVVDCVTSLAGMPVDVDELGIDAAASCSQKCFGAPPGLGPVTFGPRAMDAIERRTHQTPTWYLDLSLLFQYWGTEARTGSRAFHHTAPVASMYAFHRALELILEEGLDARYERHRQAHRHFAAALERLGVSFFTPAEYRLPMLNVVNIPDDIDDVSLRAALLQRGIEIAPGFGPLLGKVWRIGLMGYNARLERIDVLIGALEEVMIEQRATRLVAV